LVLTNDDFISDIEMLAPLGKSDHSVLGISVDISRGVNKSEKKYKFSKANFKELSHYMDCNWDEEFGCDMGDVDRMWSRFAQKLKKGMNLHIPRHTNSEGDCGYSRPLSSDLRDQIKLKHYWWRAYMKTKRNEDFTQYKKIRNKVKSLIRQRDRQEEESIAKQVKLNPKKFWKYVNNKTKNRKGIPSIRYQLNGQDVLAETDQEKADVLNNYFNTVFSTRVHGDDKACTLPIHDYNCRMSAIVIDEGDVKKRLKKLKVCKSAGIDNLYPIVLKELADVICYPVKLIYQYSLKYSQVPTDWRSSNICPIFKKGKRDSVSNYRPISLTCILCKVMEGIIKDHVTDYFRENVLFNTSQYGFIRGRSTTSQLLKMVDDWTSLLEQGGQIDVVYTDLEKAFDKVPHEYLIQKLKAYNLDEEVVGWIGSFLSDRRQRVVVNGTGSEWSDVASGVPQGSVLGPLMFIIYINDLVDYCGENARILMFADDCKIYKHISNMQDSKDLQTNLSKIVEWFNNNLMILNVAKCKYVAYGRKIMKNLYEINNVTVDNDEKYKDLGVLFDEQLKFDSHIHDKIKRANSMLGMIKRNFKNLTTNAYLLLYKSLVRSHLEYAEAVWSPYRVKDIEKIERVQMRAVKFITRNNGQSYEDRLRTLKLPTLRFRRVRGDMIEVFKIVNGVCDSSTSVQIDKSIYGSTRGNSLRLRKVHVNYDLRKFCFSNRVIDLWNCLSDDVVSAPSVNAFKGRLDKFWSGQCMWYDWRSDITGVGSRSC
jgi:hypothetical protein